MFLDLRRASGLTTLLVTHDLHEAALLADRVAVLPPGAPGPGGSSRRAGRAAGDAVRRRAARARAVRPGARVSGARAAAVYVCADAGGCAGRAGTNRQRLRAEGRPVVVGTKPFGESFLLGELFAQILEARGIPATRRFGLGGTEIVFPALRQGAIDVFPEYTGSGLLVILKAPLERDPRGGVRHRLPRVRAPVRRPLAAAAGLREHLRDVGAHRAGRAARAADAERLRAGQRRHARRLHRRLHRPARRPAGPARRLRPGPEVGERAGGRRQVPGAGRRGGGHHRRLFDRRAAGSLSDHRPRRRSPVLPALRRRRAGAWRALPASGPRPSPR